MDVDVILVMEEEETRPAVATVDQSGPNEGLRESTRFVVKYRASK